jgi:hypothetical protein
MMEPQNNGEAKSNLARKKIKNRVLFLLLTHLLSVRFYNLINLNISNALHVE